LIFLFESNLVLRAHHVTQDFHCWVFLVGITWTLILSVAHWFEACFISCFKSLCIWLSFSSSTLHKDCSKSYASHHKASM